VKLGHPSNYFVQVFPSAWLEEPGTAPLYEGIYSVRLNAVLPVLFVPDASAVGPPWRPELLPTGEADLRTAEQVRAYEIMTASYTVTPHPALAGTTDRFAFGTMPCTVFYVSPAEYAGYAAELEELAEIASDANPRLRRDDLLDRAVIRFVDRQVLGSPLLAPLDADTVGKRGEAISGA
jgi:hypothetical protein